MITSKWKILNMSVRPAVDNLSNVVSFVMYEFYLFDDEKNEKIVIRNGGQYLAVPVDSSNFIDFNNLTEEEVISWVKQDLGPNEVELLERMAQHKILQLQEVQYQPVTVFPWDASTSTVGGT